MRANEASKPIDSPGESGEQSWRGGFVPLARVPSQVPFFSRFRGGKTFPRVSVRLASKRPFLGRFGALSDGASRDVIARKGGRSVPQAQG